MSSADSGSGHSLVNEGIRIVLLVASFLVLLSLVSYHPSDPSWNVVNSSKETLNWIGPVGAVASDLLLQIFGLAAFVLPVAVGIGGWRALRLSGFKLPAIRITGLVLLMVSTTAVLDLVPKFHLRYLENVASSGGVLGAIVFSSMAIHLNTVGTAIVLGLILLLSLMMSWRFSIETTVSDLRHREDGFVGRLIYKLKDWKEARKERKLFEAEIKSQPKAAQPQLSRGKIVDLEDDEESEDDMEVAPIISPAPATIAGGSALNTPSMPAPSSRGAAAGTSTTTSRMSKEAAPETIPIDLRRDLFAVMPPKADSKNNGDAKVVSSKTATEVPATALASAAGAGAQTVLPVGHANGSIRKATILDQRSVEGTVSPSSTEVRHSRKKPAEVFPFLLPDVELLDPPEPRHEQIDEELRGQAKLIEARCLEFSVAGRVQRISSGPVVTTFEFKPDPGVKYSRITSLVDDLCLAMKAESIRIDRIPGKSTVGIEVPNRERDIIHIREVLESHEYQRSRSRLTLALGKTIDGSHYVTDLARMPHLLIAGATGAGKSVAVNGMILSILYKASPDEVKFIMVDPKRLELGLYEGIPHLLTPIVTDPKRAANALKWAVNEMEQRYKTLAQSGVRNIDQYNLEVKSIVDQNLAADSAELPKSLPYIVILVDELADLMMVASNEVEFAITRLAQMARAVGIHLVLATQRPSVDVITGLIKANFPSRIAFRASSKVDSRTILDANGAEQLLGRGDMLFLPPGSSRLIRVHGSFVEEDEIKRAVDHLKAQAAPVYDETVTQSDKETESTEAEIAIRDDFYYEAVKIVMEMGRASTSVLQRRLRIGYGRAAAILDLMEKEGIIGPPDGSKPRKVLVNDPAFYDRVAELSGEET